MHNYVKMRDGFKYENTFYKAPLSSIINSSYLGRAVRDADIIRKKFTEYFINEGKLELQNKMI